MTNVFEANPSKLTDTALLIARVVISAMMLSHGLPKVTMLLNGPVTFFSVMGISPTISLALTLFAQVICSMFVVVGALTRLALIPLIVTMLVAVVVIHNGEPFLNKEPALHFLLVYVVLILTGPGKYAIERLAAKTK